jgi:MoaA/NifB/PqqE/SkfB family radical SAM enzyme
MIPDKSLSFNLEPTFRCNLECPMCPRFSSEDPYLDMSRETFGRIVDAMGYAHTVDFTGWGEPMLHREIYGMIAAARAKGCVTTMTSNGTTLNESNGRRLIDAGLDRLVVSVDGMTPETYDPIRIGADFHRVTRNVRRFSRLIEDNGNRPSLGIAFTIQEGNARDLDRILPWMESVGARILHLKHLNVISNRSDWEQSFLKYRLSPVASDGARLLALEAGAGRVIEEAPRRGIQVHMHSEHPLRGGLEGRHCLATPLNSAYFSYEGRVAPCCHFGHHVSRFFDGRQYPARSLFYGDIQSQSFERIWASAPFAGFRRGFETGDYPEACRTCYLLYGK